MYLKFIPLILSILSELPGLISKAEAAFSGKPGTGELKKAFIMEAVNVALDAYAGIATDHPLAPELKTAILNTVNSVTDATVAGFNLAGVFKTDNPLTPPAVNVIPATKNS
jgi:hypothetical protein